MGLRTSTELKGTGKATAPKTMASKEDNEETTYLSNSGYRGCDVGTEKGRIEIMSRQC